MISDKQARTMILAAFWAMAMGAAQAGPVCASAEQVTAVRAALEGRPPAPLAVTAAQLGLSESVVASALPAAQAHGIAPENFAAVWKSLERWENAVALVMRGPDVIEIEGPVGLGVPSKRSKFFNLERRDGGLAGHLRPDLYAAIYALDIPGKDGGGLHGVSFHDATGAAVFSVFVPGEGAPPTPAVMRQFRETLALVRGQPAICPR